VSAILPYRFVDRIAALPFVDAVWLFGSRARGDAAPTSDIDLAVACPRATPAQWHEILGIVEDADVLLPIDCVRLDEAPEALRSRVMREGRRMDMPDDGRLEDRHSDASGRVRTKLANLDSALARLEEAVAAPIDPARLIIDGTIKRFEFTFELFWKTLAAALFEVEGEPQRGPRPTLTTAVARGWLTDQKTWLDMLKARNETTHIYKEAKALEVYARIRTFLPALRAGRDAIVARLGEGA